MSRCKCGTCGDAGDDPADVEIDAGDKRFTVSRDEPGGRLVIAVPGIVQRICEPHARRLDQQLSGALHDTTACQDLFAAATGKIARAVVSAIDNECRNAFMERFRGELFIGRDSAYDEQLNLLTWGIKFRRLPLGSDPPWLPCERITFDDAAYALARANGLLL